MWTSARENRGIFYHLWTHGPWTRYSVYWPYVNENADARFADYQNAVYGIIHKKVLDVSNRKMCVKIMVRPTSPTLLFILYSEYVVK